MFPNRVLAAYREAVSGDKGGVELQAAIAAVRKAGDYEVGGERYKRVPRGFEADHPRADLLRYKGLYASSPPIKAKTLTSGELVDVCFEHAVQMAPIHRWLVRLAQGRPG